MKRFVSVLAGLLVLPAFAEVMPAYYYDDVVEYVDPDYVEDDDVIAEETAPTTTSTVAGAANSGASNPRSATTGRASVSRAVPASANTTNVNSRATGTNARGVATRVNSATVARATASGATRSNAAATTTRGVSATRANGRTVSRTNNNAGLTTRANANAANRGLAARASIIQTDTVNNPLYNARASVRTSSVTSRVPTIRMSGTTATAETPVTTTADTVNEMDELAQMTDFCKAQYSACMDNFCNVLDDNQGRCSCSRNLKNYEKTETALKTATEELQEVAQKIQYIGLTGDEVETLFTQTEAEAQMQQTSDSTQLKNDLDRIKKMIVDVRGGSASVADAGLSMDFSGLLDFSIDSMGFDLSSLLGGGTNTSSISNQRGENLYKTAAARCKAAVLNSCSAQGVDIAVITNSYDLEIDKSCVAYERALTDSNDQMASTVRNAKSVLQKARLMVAQQKNQYDMRGCINALDSCMQDDFVCGDDYENCLDPSGKYIVNGEIVMGSTPGVPGDITGALYTSMWNTDTGDKKSAWAADYSLPDFIDATIVRTAGPINVPKNMVAYIQQKIGYIDSDGKVQGLCASVMNRCQDYTYTGTGGKHTFKMDNQVVRGYLERVLMQVKARQDSVLADYAENCISDVAACLSQNSSGYSWGGNGYTANSAPSDVAIRACMSVINTCKSLTTRTGDTTSVKDWLNEALSTGYNTAQAELINKINGCYNTGGTWNETGNKCDCGGGTWVAAEYICKQS